MNGFQKFWGHLSTITRHRHRVIAHCARAGILWQGLRHDLTKYSPTEFWQGVKFFDGTHSPTEDERRTLGYSLAWMHHKGRNRHHWEYWTDHGKGLERLVRNRRIRFHFGISGAERRFQSADRMSQPSSRNNRITVARLYNPLFILPADTAFRRAQKPRAELYSRRAKHQSGRNASAVADPSRSDDRN